MFWKRKKPVDDDAGYSGLTVTNQIIQGGTIAATSRPYTYYRGCFFKGARILVPPGSRNIIFANCTFQDCEIDAPNDALRSCNVISEKDETAYYYDSYGRVVSRVGEPSTTVK